MADEPVIGEGTSRTRRRVALMVGAAVLIVAAALWAALGKKASVPAEADRPASPPKPVALSKPEPPPGGYVGSAACAECHAEISRLYAEHPMGRSLAGVLGAVPIEDYSENAVVTPPGRRSYRAEKTGSGARHHEAMVDAAGEVIYDQGVDVHYALGSGRRGRAYVIDRGGLLFLSPLNWYSGKDRWDLAPGYHPEAHPRFERRATDACLSCHSGRLAADRSVPNRYRDPPFVEEAIGCERCHGPGKAHVEFHRLAAASGAADPIVNPAKLEPDRREAVCNQCHLQGEARILRYGRTEHDFRPGDRLEDIWTVFVRGTRIGPDETTRAVSHVEQMRASKCYQGSGGALGCISCHDPHVSPTPEERPSFYDSRCLTCHAEQGCELPEPERLKPPASGSCIACHMPPLPASDVPHTSLTDHRIVRRPSAAEAVPTEDGPAENGEALEIFDDGAGRLPPIEVARARGLLLAGAADRDESDILAYEAEKLLEPVAAAAEDDVAVLEALGTVCRVQRRNDEAIGYWLRALEVDPNRESVLVSLARTYHETGRLREGIETLDRLFRINPWLSELHGRQAHMLGQLGEFGRAIQAAQRAIELNPTMSQVYGWLAEIYQSRGDERESARYRDLHRRIEGR